MGLIDFARNAGESLLGSLKGGDDAAPAVSKRVHDLGLSVEGLEVEVRDGKAIVSGKTASQEEREKAVLAVGNIQGIEQVDDRLEVDSAEPESQYYRVVSGDSLSKIAKEFYGDAMRYPVIFEANRPMLKDPDEIYPGQVLRIPAQPKS